MQSHIWTISDPVTLKEIKTAKNKQPFKSTKFSLSKFRWQLRLFPNGDKSTRVGRSKLYLYLAALNPKIKSVHVYYKYSFIEGNKSHDGNKILTAKTMFCNSWSKDTVLLTDIQKYNTLTWQIELEVNGVFDQNDNDITEQYLQNEKLKEESKVNIENTQQKLKDEKLVITMIESLSSQMKTMQKRMDDIHITDQAKYNNQFIVECKKCESPCVLRDKSAPTWKCDNCNIIYSNICNNIQQQKQPIALHNSVSTSTESDIHCVLIGPESDTNTMKCKQRSNVLIVPESDTNTNYRRNISRSLTLNICDIDSTSTETTCTFANNKKLEFKNNESKPKLILENWITISTTCTQDSMIENKSNSPNRNVEITRRKSYDYNRKMHKKLTWSPSLKALSETPELYNNNNNNITENPFCKHDSMEHLLRANQSISSHMADSVEKAYDEYINTEYCNKINDEYYENDDNGYDKYMHIVQAQQALQAAYSKGFTQGYSTGVQIQVSGIQ